MRIPVLSTGLTNPVTKFGCRFNPSYLHILCIQPKDEGIEHKFIGNLNLQKDIGIVGALEEPKHRTQTYD